MEQRQLLLVLAALAGSSAACSRTRSPVPDARPVPAGEASSARPAPVWPALPATATAAEALIRQHTRRDPARPAPTLQAQRLLRLPALERGQGLIAGEQAIWSFLGKRLAEAPAGAFLLFGGYHDSGDQLLLYRQALQSGQLDPSAATLEQLDADGAWSNLPLPAQAGDDRLLDQLLRGADPAAWRVLRRRQLRSNYTAWKFGYLETVVDLVLSARALQLPLRGCDMPRPLQARLTSLESTTRDRLRELHCLLALEPELGASAAGHRVTMFWGQDHVRPHGLPRFLHPGVLSISIYLLGRRPGTGTLEAELARSLVVNQALLVPLAADATRSVAASPSRTSGPGTSLELALLLPGPPLGGEISRSRDWGTSEGTATARVRVGSRRAGVLFLAGRELAVGPRPRELQIPASGTATYLLRTGSLRMAGELYLEAGGSLELWFDPARRSTQLEQISPDPAR